MNNFYKYRFGAVLLTYEYIMEQYKTIKQVKIRV